MNRILVYIAVYLWVGAVLSALFCVLIKNVLRGTKYSDYGEQLKPERFAIEGALFMPLSCISLIAYMAVARRSFREIVLDVMRFTVSAEGEE